jgi:hypothetical protein
MNLLIFSQKENLCTFMKLGIKGSKVLFSVRVSFKFFLLKKIHKLGFLSKGTSSL